MAPSSHSNFQRFILAIGVLLILGGCSSKAKVTFCHHPPGNPANAHTLTVKVNALRGVVNEELDYEGPCREANSTPLAATLPPSSDACDEGERCGEFNYTYGVADDLENESPAQLFEVSTTFENTNNAERKTDDAGNDPARFETGTEIRQVNTEYAEKDGLPTGKNPYYGIETNAVIFGE